MSTKEKLFAVHEHCSITRHELLLKCLRKVHVHCMKVLKISNLAKFLT